MSVIQLPTNRELGFGESEVDASFGPQVAPDARTDAMKDATADAMERLSETASGFLEAARARRQPAEDSAFVIAAVGEARARFAGLLDDDAALGDFASRAAEDSQSLLDGLRAAGGFAPSAHGLREAERRLSGLRSVFAIEAGEKHQRTRAQAFIGNLDHTVESFAATARKRPEDLENLLADLEDAHRAAGSFLAPAALSERLQTARTRLAEHAARGLIEQAPDLARAEIEDGPLFAGLDPNRKTGLAALARTAEADAQTRAALAGEQTEAHRRAGLQAQAARLRAGIESGATTRLDIENAFTDGAITEESRRDLTQSLEERDSRARARLDNAAAVANKLAAADGTGLDDEEFDPQAIEQAVEDYYETLAPALAELPPEERARVEDDLAVKLGAVPGAVINTLRAGILSGKPEQEVAASLRIAAFARQNPALIEAIPEAERTRALAVADYAALGLPAARAVELATERGVQKLSAGGTDTVPDERPLDLRGRIGGDEGKVLVISASTQNEKPSQDNNDNKKHEEQVAMGAVKEAAKFAASVIGKRIRRLLHRGTREEKVPSKNESEFIGPSIDLLIQVVRNRFLESRNNKETLTLDDFEARNEVEGIQAFTEAALSGKLTPSGQEVVQLSLGTVDDEWAAKVKKETGIDLIGFNDVIDTNQINKAFKKHGPDNETDADQEPISPEAVSIYRDVVRDFDRIFAPRFKKVGSTITYEKDIDGVIVIVQQVRVSKQELAFFNMWIKKAK